jgi:hypothetical protein
VDFLGGTPLCPDYLVKTKEILGNTPLDFGNLQHRLIMCTVIYNQQKNTNWSKEQILNEAKSLEYSSKKK